MFFSSEFLWHLIAVISMTIPNVLGYNLIFGKGKILHFGPIGISIVTAYSTFVVWQLTGSYLAAVPVGIAGAALASAFFGWISLRMEADAFGILTLALHLTFHTVVLNWTEVTGGTLGIPRIPWMPFLTDLPTYSLFVALIATFWVVFFWLLDRSSFGRKVTALAEFPVSALALGINKRRVYLICFLIAGFAAASVNIFYPQYIHLLHPSDYTFPFLILFVMFVVAGKPGSVLGVTLATILLILLREAIRFLPIPPNLVGPFRLLLFGAILFGAIWFRRDTLFPHQRRV